MELRTKLAAIKRALMSSFDVSAIFLTVIKGCACSLDRGVSDLSATAVRAMKYHHMPRFCLPA